tara:strand:+ start:1038 stop:1430 length:393 start_codon:yes stop_codon:yes gene_type:complete
MHKWRPGSYLSGWRPGFIPLSNDEVKCRQAHWNKNYPDRDGLEYQDGQLLAKIHPLTANPNCHGILLRHPVPDQIDERACFDAIALDKNVGGVTCLGFGRMSMGAYAIGTATPHGIMRIFEAYDNNLSGK